MDLVSVSQLGALAAPDAADVVVAVDVSAAGPVDPAYPDRGPGGTTRRVTLGQVAAMAPVQSVAGRSGSVSLSTADVSGLGTAATRAASDFASAAQGARADAALQPGGDGSTLAGITAAQVGAYATAQADALLAAKADASALATLSGNVSANTSAVATNTSNIATNTANIATNTTAIATKAADAAVVHLAGAETIAGAKTFTSTIVGSISGNAGTVTNGVYTTGSYADPAWLASVAGSKVAGNIAGNAAGISAPIAESQVTGLVSDLASKAPLASPTFTGPVTGAISDKGGATFSVKAYGAKGDGVTDDAAAINAATAAAGAAGGGTVVLPAGTYLVVAGPVLLPSGVTLRGEGAVLRRAASTTYTAIVANSDYATNGVGNADIAVRGVAFDGNGANNGYDEHRHCLSFIGVARGLVDGCRFVGLSGDGLYLSSNYDGTPRANYCRDIRVVACHFEGDAVNGGRNGVSVIDAVGVTIQGNTFRNVANTAQPGGIDLEPDMASQRVIGVTIAGNSFDGCHQGIVAYNASAVSATCRGLSIVNNSVSNSRTSAGQSDGNGIRVIAFTSVTVAGNEVRSLSGNGIYCGGTGSLTVSGNSLWSLSSIGIWVFNCASPVVTGNVVDGVGNNAFRFQGVQSFTLAGNSALAWDSGLNGWSAVYGLSGSVGGLVSGNSFDAGNRAVKVHYSTDTCTGWRINGNAYPSPAGATLYTLAGTNTVLDENNGSGLTALNGSAIASGTVAQARLPAPGTTAGTYADGGTVASNTSSIAANTTAIAVRLTGVTLVNSGLLHATPVVASVSGGVATLTQSLATQTANTFLAGPTSGAAAAPTMRALVAADVPALPYDASGAAATVAAASLQKSANLSDLASAATARANLGLAIGTNVLAPTGVGSGLTGMTKSQVGLGSVDNTSDAAKPISTAQAAALAAKSPLLPAATGSKSGQYYSANSIGFTTAAIASGILSLAPVAFSKPVSVADVTIEVTGAGTAGAVTRMAIYSDTGDAFPASLLLDSGGLDATTTGFKTYTPASPLALAAGTYWIGAVTQGAPATPPTIRINANHTPVVGYPTLAASVSNATSYTVTGLTGAPPATWASTTVTTNAARVLLHLA